MDAPSSHTARSAAFVLVLLSAAGGVLACVAGAMQWGFLGISVGLAGTWAMFLLGLFGFYRTQSLPRVQRTRHRAAALPAHALPQS